MRVEQLYPFPARGADPGAGRFKNAESSGARKSPRTWAPGPSSTRIIEWVLIASRPSTPRALCRPPGSASTATGLMQHVRKLKACSTKRALCREDCVLSDKKERIAMSMKSGSRPWANPSPRRRWPLVQEGRRSGRGRRAAGASWKPTRSRSKCRRRRRACCPKSSSRKARRSRSARCWAITAETATVRRRQAGGQTATELPQPAAPRPPPNCACAPPRAEVPAKQRSPRPRSWLEERLSADQVAGTGRDGRITEGRRARAAPSRAAPRAETRLPAARALAPTMPRAKSACA